MKTITDISQLDPNGVYSYADYLTWRFDRAVELLKGKIWPMSPAPKTVHQRISMKFSVTLSQFFSPLECDVFAAPFDVRLFDKKKSNTSDKEIFTVVQPDLCVICDRNKIDELGCAGAPDLIIEILSKGNSKKELRVKYNLYQESGVREYWITDPSKQTVHVFVLNKENIYILSKFYLREDTLESVIFPDMKIRLEDIFPDNID